MSIDVIVTGASRAALLLVPVALIAFAISRTLPCRPATRHVMWTALLLLALVFPFLPPAPTPDLMSRAVASTVPADSASTSLEGRSSQPTTKPEGDVTRTTASGVPRPRPSEPASERPSERAAQGNSSETLASHPVISSESAQRWPSERAGFAAPLADVSSASTPTTPRPAPASAATPNSRPSSADATPASADTTRAKLSRAADERPAATPSRRAAPPAASAPRAAANDLVLRPRARADRPLPERVASDASRFSDSSPAIRRSSTPSPDRRIARSAADAPAPAAATAPPPRAAAGDDDDRSARTLGATANTGIADVPSPSLPSPSSATPVISAPVLAAAATESVPVGPAPTVEVATHADPTGRIGPWLVAVRDVRDAIVRMPSMPASIWAAGFLFTLSIALIRTWRFSRVVRGAGDPDGETRAVVLRVASDFELARAPRVRMTDAAVSPLLWCVGRSPQLILPATLWSELDPAGRRAVVAHELAHLRRGDHVAVWLSLVVGCVYWWHPVVWWLRHRLEEDADLSCDAWVTTLMPEQRRAYATALLRARAHAGASPASPALSLTTQRTRRFARRLTMVMSRSVRPMPTIGGALLATGLAAGSWLVSPTLACPPEAPTPAPTPTTVTTVTGAVAPGVPLPPRPTIIARPVRPAAPLVARTVPAPSIAAAPPTPTPPGVRTTGIASGGDTPCETAASETACPEAVPTTAPMASAMRPAEAASPPSAPGMRPARVPAVASVPSAPSPAVGIRSEGDARLEGLESRMERIEMMLDAIMQRMETAPATAPATAADVSMSQLGRVNVTTPPSTVTGRVALPDGRRVAYWEMLNRSHRVEGLAHRGGTIEVRGDAMQGAVVEAFGRMIASDDESDVVHRMSDDVREAMWDLMARDDVPVWVNRVNGGIKVTGTPLQQMVFKSMVEMLEAGKMAVAAGSAEGDDPAAAEAALRRAAAQRDAITAAALEAAASELAAQRSNERADHQARELASVRANLMAEASALESQADSLRRDLEERGAAMKDVRETAQDLARTRDASAAAMEELEYERKDLERIIESLREQADSADDDDEMRRTLQRDIKSQTSMLRELTRRQRSLRQETRAVERERDELTRRLAELEQTVVEIESHLADVDARRAGLDHAAAAHGVNLRGRRN